MSIIYPRTLLADECTSSAFTIVRQNLANRTRAGISQVLNVGISHWRAEIETLPMSPRDRLLIHAWMESLRGGLKTAYVFDPAAKRPYHYAAALPGGFSGSGVDVTALGANTIGVSGLPSGFKFRAGDYVGLVEGAKRALHKIVEDFTGASGTLSVEPEVRLSLFTTAATLTVTSPVFEAMPEPEAPIEFSTRAGRETAILRFVEYIRET